MQQKKDAHTQTRVGENEKTNTHTCMHTKTHTKKGTNTHTCMRETTHAHISVHMEGEPRGVWKEKTSAKKTVSTRDTESDPRSHAL